MATKQSIENERIGRDWFNGFIDQVKIELEWNPCTDIHDYIDGIVKYKKNNYAAVEIKTRSKGYENFNTYWMELDKYIHARDRMRKEGCYTIWYANFFNYDTLYIFDFRKFKPTKLAITKRWVLQSTCEPWLGYTWKNFIELPRELAHKYKLVNSSWRRIL